MFPPWKSQPDAASRQHTKSKHDGGTEFPWKYHDSIEFHVQSENKQLFITWTKYAYPDEPATSKEGPQAGRQAVTA